MRTWLEWIGVAVAIWAVAIVVLFLVGRRLAARELATLLPNLVRMCRTLLRDPRVPRGSKMLVGFAVLWFISPIDLVPEFIPVLGPLDDAILAALVVRHLVKRAGREVVAEAWPGDPATLERMFRLARVR
ncbi:MAG: hypothetical protein QOH08_1423 [Chloroflexota bacterium]|nr:hypothetical protein [Chloroflexota bacterium]